MSALSLILALLLVLLNGLFVAAEFALVKVRTTQLQHRADSGHATAKLALRAAHSLDAYLSATQLGITLASLGLGWIGEPAFANLIEPFVHRFSLPERTASVLSFGFAFSVMTILHIVVGELAPKSWAIQRPESLTLLVIRPLHLFYSLFKPVIWAMNALAALVLRPFGIHPASEHEQAHSEEELRMLVSASGTSGVLNPTEVELARQVLGFADKAVGNIMVPRVEIVALDATASLAFNVALARSKPYSRYPLIDGDRDEILGVVHVKDLFVLEESEERSLRSICRPALHVPVTKPLDRMLRDFQSERTHMAIVLDEYGGTQGLVTLEDVLEEIVGEIADEHDPAGVRFEPGSPGEWFVSGSARVDKTNEVLGTSLRSDESETLNGLVFERLGRQPRRGDVVSLEDVEIRVEESDRRRARRLRVRYHWAPPSAASPAADDPENRPKPTVDASSA